MKSYLDKLNEAKVMLDGYTNSLVQDLKKYAEENPITEEHILEMKKGKRLPVGDLEEYVVDGPGFRMVYSVEQQPMGPCRHLSVSAKSHALVPHPDLVDHIMGLLGFDSELQSRGKVTQLTVWQEKTPFGPAINVLEPINVERREDA